MEIFRVKKNKNYSVICNEIFKNKNISLKAKGLLSLILSLPENWDLTIKGLDAICKEGVSSIRTTIKELMKNGYIKRACKRNEKGIIVGWEISVFEKPLEIINPDHDNPHVDNPLMDNRTQLSNKLIKDLNNKEQAFLIRKEKFLNEVKSINNEFDYISFVDYWAEPTKSWRMRKELQKTWSTERRILTWIRNDKSWNTKKISKIDKQLHSYLGAMELLEKKYEGTN
tara:strand:+ start:742 stop:1422 length:681 start_codon:yes stop_codon:yes gene_type:complete